MGKETARKNRDYTRRGAPPRSRSCWHSLVFALLLAAAGLAGAGPLVVEGVVSPAWIERTDGTREPVAVGTPVDSGERIATGQGARVRLRMSEGSAIALGEGALLEVRRLVSEASAWRGSLDLVRGTLRCSSAALSGAPVERDLSVRANTLAALIGGAEVWARSDPAADFIVLIDGRVSVAHAGRAYLLGEPRTMVVAPQGTGDAAMQRISAAQLAALAAQTEILAGSGGAWRGGRYRAVVITTVDETYALALHGRLRASGYPARLRTLQQEGSPLFQVDLAQLGGEREARAVAQRLRALGYDEARPAR